MLFPSYFFHRTSPFDAEGTRISIAFDPISTCVKSLEPTWSVKFDTPIREHD